MKLSDAIRVGSTMIKPKPGGMYFRSENAGCALGMAAVAYGCTFGPAEHAVAESERRTLKIEEVWGTWMLRVVKRPCVCWRLKVPRDMRVKDVIAHLFDRHVMEKNDWTLEQLAAWVETVEPVEFVSGDWLAIQRRYVRFLPPGNNVVPTAQELREWQVVCDAFEAQQKTTRKAGQRRAEVPVRSLAETRFMN